MNYRNMHTQVLLGVLLFISIDVRSEEAPPKKADRFDVVLLVDGTPAMAALSRKSATVVTEAMGDRHRLGIITFGPTASVLLPPVKIATVAEKVAALATLQNAPFAETKIDLTAGLHAAATALDSLPSNDTQKIIILLIGTKAGLANEAEATAFKEEPAPSLLQKKIQLFVVATPDADLKWLTASANLTGGKCLAAVDVETMTDALDMIVEGLQPQKEVIIEKEVPVKTIINQIQETSPDEKLRRNEEAGRQRTLFVVVAAMLALLLFSVIGLQWLVLRRLKPDKKPIRKDTSLKKDKSSFAELRDLAGALNNASVDTQEMIEQLNLDLEDFGVEKWRVEKMLEKRFADLALGLILLIDHLKLATDGAPSEEAKRFQSRLERVLAEAGVREIPTTVGDPFDNIRHKVVESRSTDVKAGSIAAVLRPGFEVDDSEKSGKVRVLRQAEVAVSGKAEDERKDS